MDIINLHIDQIKDVCRAHNVRRLFAYGPMLAGNFDEQSDVDLIVDFDKTAVEDPFCHYLSFKYALESVFDRVVSLLEERSIQNLYFRESIERTKTLIYER